MLCTLICMFYSIPLTLCKQIVFDQSRKSMASDETMRFIEGHCCFVHYDWKSSKNILYKIDLKDFRKDIFPVLVQNITGITPSRLVKWNLPTIFEEWKATEVWFYAESFGCRLLYLFLV